MSSEELSRLRRLRHLRIRRVKRLLRPLPRRANIHRYPVLRRFARSARRRMYLWSFRVEHVVPSIYAGYILSFLPLYGLQITISFFVALALRSNLPLLVALQLITNPFTALPIYYANYQIGRSLLGLIGIETVPLNAKQVMAMISGLFSRSVLEHLGQMASVFAVTSLGGIVVGTFLAGVTSGLYRMLARNTRNDFAGRPQRAPGGPGIRD